MSLGLVGRKIGMTRIFSDDGAAVPVTVLDVANNRVTQIKTEETDGYSAVQVTYGKRRANRVTKPQAGHLAKAGVEAGTMLKEFQVPAEQLASLKLGETISVETFAVGQLVDVSGTTKGRGFSGVIQRHHFSSNRASHGNSRSHNSPGSIGMAQDPGRVFPGKRMAGQYGNVKRTVQTLKVVRVDVERGLLLVKGAVPGAEALIHQLVTAYQANARSGNRAQKGRADINKSHKKPWAQKGTGRARAGQANSPLWRGGGKIFPSSPDENFSQKVNRKMFRAGIASILSQLVREDRLSVVDQIALDAPKTKLLAQKIKALGLSGTILLVVDALHDNVHLSSRNLQGVLVLETREVDPVSLVRFDHVLLTRASVTQFEEILA